jgi:hypothetical protein
MMDKECQDFPAIFVHYSYHPASHGNGVSLRCHNSQRTVLNKNRTDPQPQLITT